MLNQITLMGRITADPELRYTQAQTPVTSFSIACERDLTSKLTGQRETDFIDIVAWKNVGEFVSKFFKKGMMIAISGRLQIREWRDKDDKIHRNAEVVADNVYFAESRKKESSEDKDNSLPF